jgi:hypothetical protein
VQERDREGRGRKDVFSSVADAQSDPAESFGEQMAPQGQSIFGIKEKDLQNKEPVKDWLPTMSKDGRQGRT